MTGEILIPAIVVACAVGFGIGYGLGYSHCRSTLLRISQAVIGEPGTARVFGYPPPEGSEQETQ